MSEDQKQENSKFVELVERVKLYDDQEAFRQIVKALNNYLQHLSLRKFKITGTSSDDIYQEGLYALSTKAIPDYRQEKGAFVSFAKLCVRRHIITLLKSANNNKNRALNNSMSLDAPAGHDDDEGTVPISGFLSDGNDDLSHKFSRLEMHKTLKGELLSKLTPLERHVFERYLENMSYSDIVTHMNRWRRGHNRVNCKVVDNALCRIKKKALEIEAEMANAKAKPPTKVKKPKKAKRRRRQ